jgi:tyrosinase
MAVRKNVYNLTDPEWAKLVTAIKGLKNSGRYDSVYVLGHHNVINHLTPPPDGGPFERNGAHKGPSFLPWHREFLRRYEQDLQAQVSDPNLGLPYWDWATDGALSDPTNAPIFGPTRMGGSGAPVATGDFTVAKGWKVKHLEVGGGLVPQDRGLNRDLANTAAPTLPKQAHVDAALAIATYDNDPWDRRASVTGFRNTLEGWLTVTGDAAPSLHNRVHVFIGGDMGPATSPNDPIFFLHHCFVDKIWADWQAMHPTSEYLPKVAAATLLGHRWDDPMFPWNDLTKPTPEAPDIVRVRDVWDHRALGYTYDNTPASPPAEAGGCFSKLAKLFDP